MRFAAGGEVCDRTYLSATRGENLGLERSSGNAGVDPVIYSEAAARYHGHLGKTGRNKATFLPFIPSEASGFPNKNRCSRPEKRENRFSITRRRRNPRNIRWIDLTDREVLPVYGSQNQFIRTRNGPSRFLRSPITASISPSVRITWELTPPTEIPPYLRGGGAKVRGQNESRSTLGTGVPHFSWFSQRGGAAREARWTANVPVT